jgi:hypothetical protein
MGCDKLKMSFYDSSNSEYCRYTFSPIDGFSFSKLQNLLVISCNNTISDNKEIVLKKLSRF